MITHIPCIILSGGKSSRMGEDKSLLPFGNFDTLIQFQYSKLSKIFSNVFISSKTNKFNFHANLILDDNLHISSPMIALQSILKEFDNKVFIITVDIPLLKKETIEELIRMSKNSDITIAMDKEKIHNLCGIFDTSLLNNINSYIKEDIHKINYLIKNSNTTYVSFENIHQFTNINTEDEYKKALEFYKKY